MSFDLIQAIEKMAPAKHRSYRSTYYNKLRKKCASPDASAAILNAILQCQVLIKISEARRNSINANKEDAEAAQEEYDRFIDEKEQFLKLFDCFVDEIEGTIELKPEPDKWPRDHMGIRRGSAEALVDEHNRIVGTLPGSFKKVTPKGGRPKENYKKIVLLMLYLRLREYRITPIYKTISHIFYYFFDSKYETDSVKRKINELKENEALVARVGTTLLKAGALKLQSPYPVDVTEADFPEEDDISI
jgi:hypothetical protein